VRAASHDPFEASLDMGGGMHETGAARADVLVLVQRHDDALAARGIVALAVELGALDVEPVRRRRDLLVHVAKQRLDLSNTFFREGHSAA
jgi:alkylation response protein AidB-like acyl-CoA dehydrogenase